MPCCHEGTRSITAPLVPFYCPHRISGLVGLRWTPFERRRASELDRVPVNTQIRFFWVSFKLVVNRSPVAGLLPVLPWIIHTSELACSGRRQSALLLRGGDRYAGVSSLRIDLTTFPAHRPVNPQVRGSSPRGGAIYFYSNVDHVSFANSPGMRSSVSFKEFLKRLSL
mgnify:FL=1